MLATQQPMTEKHRMKRCVMTTAAILLTGLASASAIYFSAEELPDNPLAEFENSKRFTHEVEVMGGKTALVANDLGTWFSGLWHGQRLAFTVAVITIVVAVGYYFIASGMGNDSDEKTDHA